MSGFRVPIPVNDPSRAYDPRSSERESLKKKLAAMSAEKIEIPLMIGGKEVRTGDTGTQVMPHRHGHVSRPGTRPGPGKRSRRFRPLQKRSGNGHRGGLRIARLCFFAPRIC